AYTVIRDAVHLASRLEGICKYYFAQVIVGEETHRRTEDKIAFQKLDKVRVKGKGKAIDIYEPVCILGECSPEILKNLEVHKQAMEAYSHQNWDVDEQLFHQLIGLFPEDKDLYQIFIDRIAHFRKKPPGEHWDAVFIFETK